MEIKRSRSVGLAVASLLLGGCSSSSSDGNEAPAASSASDVADDAQAATAARCRGLQEPPSGTIVYSHLDDDQDWSLWVMKPDGSDPTCLLDTPDADLAPAWSPDGRRIAFTGGDDLYTADADGSNVQLLVSGDQGAVLDPDWSPDGESVVFASNARGEEQPDIMRISLAGGKPKTLIRSGDRFPFVAEPHWSPDGRTILFNATVAGGWRDLFVMRPDGSAVRRLLARGFDLDGSGIGWSPDGTKLAFQGDRGGGCIFIADADGRHVRRLAPGCAVGVDLTWSPDSSHVIWGPSDNGPGDLYSVAVIGGEPLVVEDSAVASWPAWQPT